MIKINPPHDYLSDTKICNIFKLFAEKISSNLLSSKLKITRGNTNVGNDPNSIYSLLTSKTFYDYNIHIPDNNNNLIKDVVIREWQNLSTIATSSVLAPDGRSKADGRSFHEKYSTNSHLYQNLQEYLSKHKKTTQTVRENFVKEYYKEYININRIFSVDMLESHSRYTLLSKMGVQVCPYCNMNYTVNYQAKGEKRNSADLDHFYPKSVFPLYALCLYNFVPSCPICNSRLKCATPVTRETHIYPHESSFHNKAVFKIENILDAVFNEPPSATKIYLEYQDDDKKCCNSNKLFSLESRYNELGQVAKDLIEKAIAYNDTYCDFLKALVETNKTEDDIKKMIFGPLLSEEEILNVSLGKFKNDLLKQLRVY